KSIKNYSPSLGDYHDLSRYSPNSFDLLFEIEAVCYSLKKEKVLSEVHRVLKKSGKFILFDGYTDKPRSKMTKNELLACQLTEKAMALEIFEDYSSFKKKALSAGFRVVSEENVSQFVVPTMRRFEKYAQGYF